MPSRLKITLVKSPIGYRQDQKDTVRALGLGPKMWRTVVKDDTPDIRGMVNKIRHLVRVEPFEEAPPAAPQRRAAGTRRARKPAPADTATTASPEGEEGETDATS
jgi:large subunit ribosomal protein L30